MNPEEELQALRQRMVLRYETYEKRLRQTKPVFVVLVIIGILAIGYGYFQKIGAEKSRAGAEAKAAVALEEKSMIEQKLSKCTSDLEILKTSLAECQNQTLKK